MLDADEQDILNYLGTCPKQFVSSREICRRAAGKKRFSDEPYWATQVLLRMDEKKLIEMDAGGHYRLKQDKRDEEKKKHWISPEIEKLLQDSDKDFDVLIEHYPTGQD